MSQNCLKEDHDAGGGGKEDLDADADRRKEDQRHDRKMMQDEEDVEA